MKFEVKIGRLEEAKAEALLVFAWENLPVGKQETWPSQTELIDREVGGLLKKEAEKRHFEAKLGRIILLSTAEKIPAEKILLLGLGQKGEMTPFKLRLALAKVTGKLKEEHLETLALAECSELSLIEAAVEGLLLGSYEFKKYQTKENKEIKEKEVTFLVKDARELVAVKDKVNHAEIFAQAAIFARDLVNEPSSVTTPSYLANLAEKLSKDDGFSCQVYDEKMMAKQGMGALLGVAKGSDEPSRFIKLDYRHGKKKIVLVGKGITFDTGGLSLKPQEGMETMKMDMAGAAAILAIFSVIAKLRPKVHLIGLIPATENMPSGKAIKPGDIVKTYGGKTVEVVNTDAEGRLILADALGLAISLKPDFIIDLATLTGACMVALGEEVAGLFTNQEKLGLEIKKAAQEVGEKFWPMPLEEDYKELLKSEVADLKNVTGKRYGGAITAALFLKEFVDKSPWAHLDIAGPAWEEKGTALVPRGGTGFGVRTVLQFLENL